MSTIVTINATGDDKAPYAVSPMPFKLVGIISDAEFRESIGRCNRALAPGPLRLFLRVWTFLPILGWPIILGLTFGTELIPIFAPAIYMPVMSLNIFLGLWLTSLEGQRRQRKFRAQVDKENDKYNSPEWKYKDGAANKPRISWGVNQSQLEIEVGEIKRPTASASSAIAAGQPILPQRPPFVMPLPPMQSLYPQFAAVPQGVPVPASHQPVFLASAQYAAVPTYEQNSSSEGMVTAQDELLRYTAKFSTNNQAVSANDRCARAGSSLEGVVCGAPTVSACAPADAGVITCPGCFRAARQTDRFCCTCGTAITQKPRTPSPPHSRRFAHLFAAAAGAAPVVKSSPSVL